MKIPDFKKILSHKSTNSYQSFSMMKPHHDWKIIISIFIYVSIILIAVSVYFWDKVRKEDIFETNKEAVGQSSLINQELMDTTLNRFKERENKINNFPKTSVLNIDPSK
jgi:uncharacterized membrane protein